MTNWLPIPRGAFNIMLRVYGPEGYWSDLLDHAPVAFIECFTQQLAKGGQKASHT